MAVKEFRVLINGDDVRVEDITIAEQPEWYTPEEAAAELNFTRQHIYNLIKRGELPSVKWGTAHRIPARAIEERKERSQ